MVKAGPSFITRTRMMWLWYNIFVSYLAATRTDKVCAITNDQDIMLANILADKANS